MFGNIGSVIQNAQQAQQFHASGLPNRPPAGINPQLWSSVLQHLQKTNFGTKPQGAPQQGGTQRPWSPLPSMMNTQPVGGQPFISR